MKSKDLAAELEKQCEYEGKELLTKHKDAIWKYIRYGSAYYSVGNVTAKVDPIKKVLVVTYDVGRKDPQFDDYEDSKEIPLDYFEQDSETYFKNKDLEKQIEQNENRRKQLKSEIMTLEFDIKNMNRQLLNKKQELANL